jgi:hypothetical protein
MAFPLVPLTTSSPSVELLMEVANTTQEITSLFTIRAFTAKPADEAQINAKSQKAVLCASIGRPPKQT